MLKIILISLNYCLKILDTTLKILNQLKILFENL